MHKSKIKNRISGCFLISIALLSLSPALCVATTFDSTMQIEFLTNFMPVAKPCQKKMDTFTNREIYIAIRNDYKKGR